MASKQLTQLLVAVALFLCHTNARGHGSFRVDRDQSLQGSVFFDIVCIMVRFECIAGECVTDSECATSSGQVCIDNACQTLSGECTALSDDALYGDADPEKCEHKLSESTCSLSARCEWIQRQRSNEKVEDATGTPRPFALFEFHRIRMAQSTVDRLWFALLLVSVILALLPALRHWSCRAWCHRQSKLAIPECQPLLAKQLLEPSHVIRIRTVL